MISGAFFVALPYMALIVFFGGTIYRYRHSGFTYSSISSQFLEGKKLFWGTLPFHIGILVTLFGHFIAFLFPRTVLAWNSVPARLLILEGTAITFGVLALIGIVGLLERRLLTKRIQVVSTKMDLFLEFLLLSQILLGIGTAISYRWGTSWFAADLSPYLWSILKFNPKVDVINAMPLLVQLHIIGAFLIFIVFPFTRLVHIIVAPLHYIFRPYQQFIWNWDRKLVRDSSTVWTHSRPKNT
jgi:nitrate reductase gamma subunit